MKKDLAMACAVAKNNRKKYAKGGEIKDAPQGTAGDPQSRPDQGYGAVIVKTNGRSAYARGGIVKSIMERRNKQNEDPSETADLDQHALEEPNQYDKYDEMALEGDYDLDDVEPQPMDSNQDGMDLENDEHEKDMISQLRRKARMGR